MSDAPKIVLDRLRAAAPRDDHPDADVLTAFAEQALSGAEREGVVRHLSRCGDCREVVALSLPPSVEAQIKPESVPERAPTRPVLDHSRTWFTWPTPRWAALAASVVVVGSVLLLRPGQPAQSSLETEKLDTLGNAKPPAIDNADKAVAPVHSEPAQSPAITANTFTERPVTPERRAHSRDEQQPARTQTPAAAPPVFLADKKRADSPEKDSVAFDADRLTVQQPARSETVNAEISSADHGATANGIVTNSTSAGEARSTSAQGSLVAKNDAPVTPIVKAKAATKEEAELKTQSGESAPQGKLAGAIAETDSLGARPATLAKQSRKLTAPQWSLAQGKLQRSLDAGKTWQIGLKLDQPVLSLGVLEFDAWAGSQAGALFHSPDGGATWAKINPATKSEQLAADIVAIETRSATEIVLTTSNGEFWTTTDAGKTWDKK